MTPRPGLVLSNPMLFKFILDAAFYILKLFLLSLTVTIILSTNEQIQFSDEDILFEQVHKKHMNMKTFHTVRSERIFKRQIFSQHKNENLTNHIVLI